MKTKGRKSGYYVVAIIAALIFVATSAMAQDQAKTVGVFAVPDSNHVQLLTLDDGSKLLGRISEIRNDEIVFTSGVGDITVQKSRITEIKLVPNSSIKSGKYWFDNPNTTRLYFAPTARMLKKGEAYFSDYYLFFPGFGFGITDNVTMGVGMSLIPGVDFSDQVFYFTPKIGLKATDQFHLAAGALIIALPKIDGKSPLVGILYGVGTIGNDDGSLTTGLGYGFVDDEVADKPMFMIGGEKRFSRRVSFVSENWIFPGVDQPLVSYGFRFFGEGISVDLALFNTIGDDTIFPGIPWVDFVVNF